MLNLIPHRRLHIPNGLAVLAAILLLVTSIGSFDSGSETHPSSVNAVPSINAESTENDNVNDDVEPKRRGLNLGFLLFRRG